MITISTEAAKKIKSIIEEEDPSLKLRVFVQGGGCTGFQYGFSLEELPPAEDDFDRRGATRPESDPDGAGGEDPAYTDVGTD